MQSRGVKWQARATAWSESNMKDVIKALEKNFCSDPIVASSEVKKLPTYNVLKSKQVLTIVQL
jgi:hypothetical protein